MAQQTTSGVRGIPRPVQSFSAKVVVAAAVPLRVQIGAHGVLAGRGNKIGRGL